MAFLTPGRIRNYPRVILLVVWAGVLINVAGGAGWVGLGGQLVFSDFLVFYGAGRLFDEAPAALYDFQRQLDVQQAVVAPVPLEGTGPFIHPPYVAPLFAIIAFRDVALAVLAWLGIIVIALVLMIRQASSLFGAELLRMGLGRGALATVVFSSPAVVLGIYAGQMNTLVLFGTVAAMALVLRGRQTGAGLVTGLLAVKPQVALALGLFFVARRAWTSCLAAAVAFGGLNALLFAKAGIAVSLGLYADYLANVRHALLLPFLQGFPVSLLMTPYGLLAGALGEDHRQLAVAIANVIAVAALFSFARTAWIVRNGNDHSARLLLGRALVLPFLITPYWMMYDSFLLLFAVLMAMPTEAPRRVLAVGSMVYAWLWLCVPVSALIGIPVGVVAPLALWVCTEPRVRAHAESPATGIVPAPMK